MARLYARTVWGRARAHLRLSDPSRSSQPLADFLSRGSGNGKRNQKNSKLLLEVSSQYQPTNKLNKKHIRLNQSGKKIATN